MGCNRLALTTPTQLMYETNDLWSVNIVFCGNSHYNSWWYNCISLHPIKCHFVINDQVLRLVSRMSFCVMNVPILRNVSTYIHVDKVSTYMCRDIIVQCKYSTSVSAYFRACQVPSLC